MSVDLPKGVIGKRKSTGDGFGAGVLFEEHLRGCFQRLCKYAAAGIDNLTKEMQTVRNRRGSMTLKIHYLVHLDVMFETVKFPKVENLGAMFQYFLEGS